MHWGRVELGADRGPIAHSAFLEAHSGLFESVQCDTGGGGGGDKPALGSGEPEHN